MREIGQKKPFTPLFHLRVGEKGEKRFFFFNDNSTVIRKYIYLIYDICGSSSYLNSCDPSETREEFHNCKTSSETLKVR